MGYRKREVRADERKDNDKDKIFSYSCSSYLIAPVLHYPPPPPAQTFITSDLQ
jgi:hypothetical protein